MRNFNKNYNSNLKYVSSKVDIFDDQLNMLNILNTYLLYKILIYIGYRF